jgi:two-component system, NarL family, nitrate/nitrite response regulator NarL
MKPTLPAGRVIQVVLISPFEISRTGLRLLLESRRRVRVSEAASCRAALESASVQPNVLLFEQVPESSAEMELLPQVLQAWKNVPVLILAGTRDAEAHCAFMRLGVRGLVLKTEPVEHLLRAIERLNAREVWFEPSLMEAVLTHLTGHNQDRACLATAPTAFLTSREIEVIRLLAEALPNRLIAERLFISETTIRHHLNSVFGKLGVSSRLELMKYAYCSGLAKPTAASVRTAQIA